MIVLLPVSRFRVTYEVAAGRPFSHLERMILSAIQQGASSLDGLQEIFHVHPRLLIEGLVTLTQAGWLALGGPSRGGFVLTSEGREAAGSDRPPSTTAVSSRRAFVVMERLAGGLISNDEVRFVAKRDLARVWEQSQRLKPEVSNNGLDEGQVQHLLPRRQGEWVRWIGPIDMVSKDIHWLPVNVDLTAGTVVGLPDAWVARLRSIIIEEATRFAGSLTEDAKTCTWSSGGSRGLPIADAGPLECDALRIPAIGWQVALSGDDFRFTGDEHERLLVAALREARSSVLIASAFVNAAKLEVLRSHIEAALQRGVRIDLLWGYMTNGSADTRETVEWLRKLAYRAKRDCLKGVVRFNQVPSGSHAKLLLWDGGSGFQACVGSYNWLSALVSGRWSSRTGNVSVRISEPGAVAALARCAAALWLGAESEVLTSTGDRWRRIAADLDMVASRSAPTTTNAALRVILDREHEVLLRACLRMAQRRLLVASHRLGSVCGTRLVSAEVGGARALSFDIFYGHAELGEAEFAAITALAGRAGGTLRHVPELHAKVIVSDASACVTSYNFLSADPFGTANNARELGIVIDGEEPVEWLWSRLQKDLPTAGA
jgi:hypothetical protein